MSLAPVGGILVETITIDGMDEHDFRHSIENMLRLDQVDEAIERLRVLLEPCAGKGGILPARFLEVKSSDIEFAGWHKLTERLSDHDRPSNPISAIGITLADARNLGGPGPSGGRLPPFIKTFYFGDDAFPFSIASRDDLLDGYTREGFEWEADYQATDVTLSIKGIDDLYGAVVELEERLFERANPSEDEVRAGSIGACYIAALIHQSLRETIREKGLPRPLCVLVACDGVYPFFDAPVVGSEDPVAQQPDENSSDDTLSDEVWPSELEGASTADDDDFSDNPRGDASLLATFSRKGTKKPVLVVTDDDVRESAQYIERAEAQWLVVEDRELLTRLQEGTDAPTLTDIAAIGDPAAWGNFDLLDHRAELEDLPTIEPEASLTASNELEDHSDALPEMATPLASTDDHEAPEPLDESFADTELADQQFASPAGHSLRARIKLVEPDLRVTTGDRIRAMFRRLRKLFFRR
jgi:hypothetical protein